MNATASVTAGAIGLPHFLVLAAAEATVALAIVLAVYRGYGTIDVTDVRSLKD